MKRTSGVAAAICFALLACSPASPRVAENTAVISGRVVERLESPPYVFLRIESKQGGAWAAVPIAPISVGDSVTLVNGVQVRSYDAKPIGKRFEPVVFGTLAPR